MNPLSAFCPFGLRGAVKLRQDFESFAKTPTLRPLLWGDSIGWKPAVGTGVVIEFTQSRTKEKDVY